MWHSPNQKSRGSRRKDRNRKIHIRRINAQIEVQLANAERKTLAQVRVVLNDLTHKGVGIFSSISVPPGQELTLQVIEPVNIALPAKVLWCQDQAVSSHILTQQPYSFRAGLEFIIAPGTEKEAEINAFYERVTKELL